MVAVGMLIVAGAAAQEATQSETDTKPSPQAPVFRGEADVNVVNAYVTVRRCRDEHDLRVCWYGSSSCSSAIRRVR